MKIHDVLYGQFELPKFLDQLLTSPEFRRLTEVRLININSPTLSALAEVRRYSHTLGVLRLAIENPFTNLGRDEHRALLASIIVHDAGTPAFAHLFEYQLRDKFNWDHESAVPQILLKQHHDDRQTHQFYASRRPEFETLCNRSEIDFSLVLDIIQQKHFAAKFVFGSVDFDNLDNVARMNCMLGYQIPVDVFLRLARALSTSEKAGLLLPEYHRQDLQTWANLRRQAYEVLVFDGPTVSGQAILSSLISEALNKKFLSVNDWHYNDYELISVLKSMPGGNERLQRDFFGPLPEMKLIIQISDRTHPIYAKSKDEISQLVQDFLLRQKVLRSYGYSLLDRGTFEKRIAAVDPDSGRAWSIGKQSESLIVYGFGKGGRRLGTPFEVGRDFLEWVEKTAC